MCKCIYTYKKTLFLSLIFILLSGTLLNAQTFTSISTSDKCATNGDRRITVDFSFEGIPFPLGNNFIIELSDISGNFTDSSRVIETLTDDINNISFDVSADIDLPRTIEWSDDYKIRVRASSDSSKFIESTVSYSFSYIPSVGLALNNNQPLFLCNGESANVSFDVNGLENIGNTLDDYSYAVFKDNVLYDIVDTTSFTITEEGSYFVSMYFGSECSLIAAGIYKSNAISVQVLNFSSVTLKNESEVEICASDSYKLEAAIDNASYSYKWYKNEVLITGLPDYSPVYNTTNDGFQFGVYYVVIEAGNCSATSQEVEVLQRGAGFTITAVPDIATENSNIVILLPESNITLNAVTDPVVNGLDYEWLDQNDFRRGLGEQLNVFFEGEYYVQVTDDSGDCPVVINSEPITFLDAVDLEVIIEQDEENCSAESTILNLDVVNALATDGKFYPLSTEEIVNFKYQWLKNGINIPGANTSFYEVLDYQANDLYLLNVSVGSGLTELNNDSNILDVRLRPDAAIKSSSESNQLCPGTAINLSIDILSGFDYKWFKDDEELTVTDVSNINVTEVGKYYASYDGFGCFNRMEIVEIEEFTDDSVAISPITPVLIDGEELILSATGADAYEWYNEDGNLLSSFEEVEVDVIGTYTLIAQVENCSVEKKIQVQADDGSVKVPNIISPFNGDEANDTWKIPNRLSFQQNVNVIVYNSRGQEILNTFEYQNNWPEDVSNIKGGMVFYYKISQENTLIKAGTISVLD